MYTYRGVGLAAVAAAAVGLLSAGPAFGAPASAADNTGSAFIANNTLIVTGTNGDDIVALGADATTVQVAFGADPANAHRFPLGDFNAILVSLGNGDDQFTEQSAVLSDKALTVDGGNGNDTITTGDGNDVIYAGNGNDTVDAGRGNDTVLLGNGNDFFVWNPGEGSDTVDGGNGAADVMQFNGANVSEKMSLSAEGSHAIFARDVANIRMDLTNMEIFNLRALGGSDNITIDNLEGTSIRHANIDLSRSIAVGNSPHVVTVDGTNQADRVDVTARDGQIDVKGLRAETQITGSDTSDHLQINTLDGNDKVTVDPNVAPLIGLGVDLGLGQG
jgi:Ca2+-binding RTX toxin-like protein